MVGDEHEPVVLELRLVRCLPPLARLELLLEEPAVRHVSHLYIRGRVRGRGRVVRGKGRGVGRGRGRGRGRSLLHGAPHAYP